MVKVALQEQPTDADMKQEKATLQRRLAALQEKEVLLLQHNGTGAGTTAGTSTGTESQPTPPPANLSSSAADKAYAGRRPYIGQRSVALEVVDPSCNYYVEPSNAEETAYLVNGRKTFLLVPAPRQSGKTTLSKAVERRLELMGYQTAYIDISRLVAKSSQKVAPLVVNSIWAAVIKSLGITSAWDDPIEVLESLLSGAGAPVVLIFDEIDVLDNHDAVLTDFLSGLRALRAARPKSRLHGCLAIGTQRITRLLIDRPMTQGLSPFELRNKLQPEFMEQAHIEMLLTQLEQDREWGFVEGVEMWAAAIYEATGGHPGTVGVFLCEIDKGNFPLEGLDAWQLYARQHLPQLLPAGAWSSYHSMLARLERCAPIQQLQEASLLEQMLLHGSLIVPYIDEVARNLIEDGLICAQFAPGGMYELQVTTPHLQAVMTQACVQSVHDSFPVTPVPAGTHSSRGLGRYLLENVIRFIDLRSMTAADGSRADGQPGEWALQMEAAVCLKAVLAGSLETRAFTLTPEVRTTLLASTELERWQALRSSSNSSSSSSNSSNSSSGGCGGYASGGVLSRQAGMHQRKKRLDHLVSGSMEGTDIQLGFEYAVAADQPALDDHVLRSIGYATSRGCHTFCINLRKWAARGPGNMSTEAHARQADMDPASLMARFPRFGCMPPEVEGVNVLLQLERGRAYVQYGDDGPITVISLQPISTPVSILPAAIAAQARARESSLYSVKPYTPRAAASDVAGLPGKAALRGVAVERRWKPLETPVANGRPRHALVPRLSRQVRLHGVCHDMKRLLGKKTWQYC